MSVTSKSAVLVVGIICGLFAALVVVFVRGAVGQRGVNSDEGYYSPVYSPARESHTHRDYSTSARLNKFLKAGKTRFYVEYLGVTD